MRVLINEPVEVPVPLPEVGELFTTTHTGLSVYLRIDDAYGQRAFRRSVEEDTGGGVLYGVVLGGSARPGEVIWTHKEKVVPLEQVGDLVVAKKEG